MGGQYLMTGEEALPEVPRVPAPWTLEGSAWILVLRLPEAVRSSRVHLVPELRDAGFTGPSVVMFVDYRDSPVGPYRELLYIPGRFTDRGQRAGSVTRIWVSTWESVVNGRRNWGIPKDRADFLREERAGKERITVRRDAAVVARLDFAPLGPALPVTTAILPPVLRRLVQYHGGRRYSLAPSVRGRVGAARVLRAEGGAGLFPDLARGRTLAALRVPGFTMTFPEADIVPAREEKRP